MLTTRRIYDGLIHALAYFAAGILVLLSLVIVGDVVMRNAGLRPFAAVSALSEYALLYVTMASAPFLVRRGGHVAIDSFTSLLPGTGRRLLATAVALACALISAVLSFYAAMMIGDSWSRGDVDIRSIDLPKWLLFLPLCVGFALAGIEFLRLLVRSEIERLSGHTSEGL